MFFALNAAKISSSVFPKTSKAILACSAQNEVEKSVMSN
jgi:hypothetical protein